MKLYLSGAITGIQDYKERFKNAEQKLINAGYEIENPASYEFLENGTWEEAMKYDIRKMLQCDGVALLDNWETSKGAQIERQLARNLSIPVLPVREWYVKKL